MKCLYSQAWPSLPVLSIPVQSLHGLSAVRFCRDACNKKFRASFHSCSNLVDCELERIDITVVVISVHSVTLNIYAFWHVSICMWALEHTRLAGQHVPSQNHVGGQEG